MNTKQRLFVEEYVKCLNAAEAARRVGYSTKAARQVGQRLLTRDDVQEAIQEIRDQLAEEARIDREEWIRRLSRLSLEAQPDGAQIRALRELGLALGFYAPDKVEVSAKGGITFLPPIEGSPPLDAGIEP